MVNVRAKKQTDILKKSSENPERVIRDFFKENYFLFESKRIRSIREITLKNLMEKCSTLRCISQGYTTPEELIKCLLLKQTDTICGNNLGHLVEDLIGSFCGALKSRYPGVDREFFRGDELILLQIKSFTNWSNANSLEGAKEKFKKAVKLAQADYPNTKISCIIGVHRGVGDSVKDGFRIMAGSSFFEWFVGVPNLNVIITRLYEEFMQTFSTNIYDEEYSKKEQSLLDEFKKSRFCKKCVSVASGEGIKINFEEIDAFISNGC
jgi:hypothetical protein